MGFTKGNKQGGRTKGAKNKATGRLRDFVTNFLEDNLERIQADFEALEAKERIDTYIKLLEYGLPKMKRKEPEEPEQQEREKQVIILGGQRLEF